MCFYAMMTLTQSNKLRTKIRKERNSVFKIALHIVKKRKQILFTRKMPKQNKKESEKKRNPSDLNALERNERLRIKNLEIKIKQEEKKTLSTILAVFSAAFVYVRGFKFS